jgi:hypothetical protein
MFVFLHEFTNNENSVMGLTDLFRNGNWMEIFTIFQVLRKTANKRKSITITDTFTTAFLPLFCCFNIAKGKNTE